MKTKSSSALQSPFSVSLSHAWPVIIIYLVFLVLMLLLGMTSPFFSSPVAVNNLLGSALPLAFPALAQMVVVLVKGIDLSVGPAMSVVMVVAASLAKDTVPSTAGVYVLCLGHWARHRRGKRFFRRGDPAPTDHRNTRHFIGSRRHRPLYIAGARRAHPERRRRFCNWQHRGCSGLPDYSPWQPSGLLAAFSPLLDRAIVVCGGGQ